MSVDCTRRVWDHSSQKGSALFVLVALADYADKNGFAFPGLATLADKIRMSRRQIIRLVGRLEEAGELLVLRREGRGNLYVVRTGAGREALAVALERAVRRGASLPGGTVERTLDLLLGVEPEAVRSRPGTRDKMATPPGDTPSPRDQMAPPGDNLAASGDNSTAPGDTLASTGDTTTAPDPSGSITDPPGSIRDPSGGALWARALKYLPLYMDRRTFDHWLRGTRALAVEGDCLVVEARTPYAVDWLEHRLAPHIDRALRTYLPGYQVRFVAPGPGPVPGSRTGPGTDPGPDPGTDPRPDPGPDPDTDPGPDPGMDPGPDPGTAIPGPAAGARAPRPAPRSTKLGKARVQAGRGPRAADPAPRRRTPPAAGALYALSGPESASGSTRTTVRGWPFAHD